MDVKVLYKLLQSGYNIIYTDGGMAFITKNNGVVGGDPIITAAVIVGGTTLFSSSQKAKASKDATQLQMEGVTAGQAITERIAKERIKLEREALAAQIEFLEREFRLKAPAIEASNNLIPGILERILNEAPAEFNFRPLGEVIADPEIQRLADVGIRAPQRIVAERAAEEGKASLAAAGILGSGAGARAMQDLMGQLGIEQAAQESRFLTEFGLSEEERRLSTFLTNVNLKRLGLSDRLNAFSTLRGQGTTGLTQMATVVGQGAARQSQILGEQGTSLVDLTTFGQNILAQDRLAQGRLRGSLFTDLGDIFSTTLLTWQKQKQQQQQQQNTFSF